METPVLHVRNLSKSYPGVRALEDVDLAIRPGTVHALIGENGAGKSTLIKCLAGVVRPDRMNVSIDGRARTIRSASDAKAAGLAFIHQELNLIEYFTAGENVYLGHVLPRTAGLYDRRKLGKNAREVFNRLDVEIPLDEPVRYLTPGQRAIVAIGRAFAHEARVYFMDEPGTTLAPREKDHLFAMIRRLVEQNKAVVYVTHNLDDVLRISGEITVLREGERVSHRPSGETTREELISAMIGETPAGTRDRRIALHADRREVLAVGNLAGAGVGPVSFSLGQGEILGIGGLVGSGRSTLLKLVAGAARAEQGTLRFDGVHTRLPRSPAEALGLGIAYVPEERRSEGLALQRSVLENTIISGLKYFSRTGFLHISRARSATQAAGRQVRLKTASYRNPVRTLSGGNQQKVLFARAVLANPRVLLLDEPTKGVDVGARLEIYDTIRELATRGIAIIVVSSDFDEILTLSDRLLFLHEGRMGRCVENDGLTQNEYLSLCYQGVAHD